MDLLNKLENLALESQLLQAEICFSIPFTRGLQSRLAQTKAKLNTLLPPPPGWGMKLYLLHKHMFVWWRYTEQNGYDTGRIICTIAKLLSTILWNFCKGVHPSSVYKKDFTLTNHILIYIYLLFIYLPLIEVVRAFKYLGSILTQDANLEREILCWIALADSAFNCLRNVWRNNKCSQELKLRIYNSSVLSVLTYGCETWSITAQLEKRLRAFDNNCLRSILNIHWAEKIRNYVIYSMTNHTPILDAIRKRRWMYWGHMVRMGDGRLPRDIWCWTPPGLRKSGRPKMTIDTMLEKQAKLARSPRSFGQGLRTGRRGKPLLLPYAPSRVGGPKSK